MTMRSMALLIAFASSFIVVNAQAAIFSCKGADGSRVFSDTPCEDAKKASEDAKQAGEAAKSAGPTGVEAKQPRGTASSNSNEPANQPVPSASVELKQAQTRCREGHKTACEDASRLEKHNEALLREQLQRGCDRGSATECEELYCRAGISKQCRDAMTQTGALVGSNWYIRKQPAPVRAQGSTEYVHAVTCDPKAQIVKDTTVYCVSETTNCGARFEPKKVKTLEAAADYVCTRR
jgi:Domain of unknown function (DUF4124)